MKVIVLYENDKSYNSNYVSQKDISDIVQTSIQRALNNSGFNLASAVSSCIDSFFKKYSPDALTAKILDASRLTKIINPYIEKVTTSAKGSWGVVKTLVTDIKNKIRSIFSTKNESLNLYVWLKFILPALLAAICTIVMTYFSYKDLKYYRKDLDSSVRKYKEAKTTVINKFVEFTTDKEVIAKTAYYVNNSKEVELLNNIADTIRYKLGNIDEIMSPEKEETFSPHYRTEDDDDGGAKVILKIADRLRLLIIKLLFSDARKEFKIPLEFNASTGYMKYEIKTMGRFLQLDFQKNKRYTQMRLR